MPYLRLMLSIRLRDVMLDILRCPSGLVKLRLRLKLGLALRPRLRQVIAFSMPRRAHSAGSARCRIMC